MRIWLLPTALRLPMLLSFWLLGRCALGMRRCTSRMSATMPRGKDEADAELPPLTAGQTLRLEKLEKEQKFTQPPARYSEASLVRELEELGIGRPSTYAAIISTLQDREYVSLKERHFVPTDLGRVVCSQLVEHFGNLMRLPVSAVDVKVADAPWPSQFQAQASGSRSVEVRARVQGIIEKRLYNEGDFVKAGQQLFQLERDQYEAQMQQAQAQYVNAEREWRRIRPLYEKNAVSQKDRDAALASYDSAKAALRQAKINLDYCQVVAPVSGYSSKENYTPGNLVSNNSLLTYVNQTDPMYIDFSIAAPERMPALRDALERAPSAVRDLAAVPFNTRLLCELIKDGLVSGDFS